jgi:hypothetical protein
MPVLFAEDTRVTMTSTPWTQVFSPISDLWPGFSTLTLARVGSRLGQRPLWESATPCGNASERVTRRGRLPVSLVTSASSPSASPRSAASAGCIAMVDGPRRAAGGQRAAAGRVDDRRSRPVPRRSQCARSG